MDSLYSIYNDIAKRTRVIFTWGGGGTPSEPARVNFIKKFMDYLPCRFTNIKNPYDRREKGAVDRNTPKRSRKNDHDTLSQEFIPSGAVTITMEDNVTLKVQVGRLRRLHS